MTDRLSTPGKVYDHDPAPDSMPGPGDTCKRCGEDITWIGPSQYDWLHVDDILNRSTTDTCKHCGHGIVKAQDGTWCAPDAGNDREYGDGIWLDTCPDAVWPDTAHEPDLVAERETNHSAEFGEKYVVRIEYNTDFDGREIDPDKEERPYTLHGPFHTDTEADAWAESYPDGDTDIHDILVCPLNLNDPGDPTDRANSAQNWVGTLGTTSSQIDLYNVVTMVMEEWYEDADEAEVQRRIREAFNTLVEQGGVDYDSQVGELLYWTVRDRVSDALEEKGFRPA